MDSMEPRYMPYKLLDEITGGFSEELGRGGFGVVYKGVDKDGQEIAVKVLYSTVGNIDGQNFRKEFDNISRLKHSNIVRLVGFCDEAEEELTEHNGELVKAVRIHRALCLEYMHNRNLEKYISDEHHGLSWQARYRIIKGICEGLKYLHTELESPICHLDLKPANILLDKNMIPKIADFGLSRLIGEDNTKRTITEIGTEKYMPPEFIKYRLTSKEYDIYSLGVIIIMVLVGNKGFSRIADMELADFFDLIHTKWRERLLEIPGHMSLEADCQQVKKCIEIASKCIADKKYQRPSIKDIVDLLNQIEIQRNDLPLRMEEVSIDLPRREQTSSIHRLEPAGPVKVSTKPRYMPYKLLKEITGGFSKDNLLQYDQLGVYKGVDKDGQEIAVKLLDPAIDLDGDKVRNELDNISGLKHSNIVQLVGFCCEEEEEYVVYHGELVAAVVIYRALCFEYTHNGSLAQYIHDEHEGLSWPSRYRIIKGICEGLQYLHTELILHLSLCPAHILLDKNMTPKISDFSLSRVIDEENTRRTTNLIQAMRYIPPEYVNYGIISKEYDIYSLGITIIQIMVGYNGYCLITQMGLAEFAELVHNKWGKRLQEIPRYMSLEADIEQVKKCIEIALKCVEKKRNRRPSIQFIVDQLCQTEKCKNDLSLGTEEIRPIISTELLDIYPQQLRFALKPNKSISRSLHLTNKSYDCVAVRLQSSKGSKRFKMPLFGIVPPRSTYTLVVTTREQKKELPDNDDSLTLESIIVGEGDLSMKHTDQDSAILEYKNIFKKAKETDANNLHELKLPILVSAPPGDATTSSQPVLSEVEITSNDFGHVLSVDVHPTKSWIMTSHYGGNVVIWNYKKQETENIFKLTKEPVYSTKFIERERWLVAGDRDGTIYVYNYYYPEGEVLDIEEAHDSYITSLDVHPTEPFVLSSSNDHFIKLWGWGNGWKCARTFKGHSDRVTQVHFIPADPNCFASASLDHTIRIWSISSSESKMILCDRPNGLLCVHNYISDNRKYLISGFGDGTVQVWRVRKNKCVKTFQAHLNRVSSVCSHPELGLLITGSYDGTVRVWNSTTYRLENIIGTNLGAVYALGYIESIKRLVIGCYQGMAIVELKSGESPGYATTSSQTCCGSLNCGDQQPLLSEFKIVSKDFAHVLSVDVHRTKPWIMTSHYGGNVLIWNYKKQETKNIFEITTEPVYSTKFIEREEWLVAGDRDGTIYICNYYVPEYRVRIIEEAHDSGITSLDVHPTGPFVLSSSDDHLIKLWDWENGWRCIRTFEGHSGRVTQANFLPTDAYHFASASIDHTIRIWDISSSESKMTLCDRPDGLLCVQNYISNNRKYFISGFGDGCAQVWDMEEERCVQTLEGHLNHVSSVYSNPELGVLITGSYDGTVRVWNSTTYRLENIIGVNLGAVYALGFIGSLKRVVIGCYQGMAIVELKS